MLDALVEQKLLRGGCLSAFVVGKQAQPSFGVVFQEIDDAAEGVKATGE